MWIHSDHDYAGPMRRDPTIAMRTQVCKQWRLLRALMQLRSISDLQKATQVWNPLREVFILVLFRIRLLPMVSSLFSSLYYRSKLDRWPRHVTPSEKRPFFDVITLFATYILGQKVDPKRNVTASRCRDLGQKVDPIRNVTASHLGYWAIKLTQ